VSDDSAAKQAGLRPAVRYDDGSMELDVIVSIDKQPVETVEDLQDRLDQHAVGDVVALGIRRGAKVIDVSIKLREIKE
jgi:S1-C subfamily serine protease